MHARGWYCWDCVHYWSYDHVDEDGYSILFEEECQIDMEIKDNVLDAPCAGFVPR